MPEPVTPTPEQEIRSAYPLIGDFTKTVRIGRADIGRKNTVNVFCKIRYTDGRLSITGVEGPRQGGNCVGSCGQIDAHPWHITVPAPGWNKATIKRFREVWGAWHLNDMRPACPHQRQRGETYQTHPDAVCPDCGYRLGSAWLKESVPEDVLAFLLDLPNTDITPAWV